MRRTAAVLLLPVLAACASNAAPTPASPAEVLRLYDSTGGRMPAPLGDYQAAFDKVTPKCTNDPAKLPAMVEATNQILVSAGITDETGLTVLNHLDQSLPAGSPAMDCTEILAAYATLREG